MDRIQQFVKERDEVLFSLDRKRIEKYLRKRGIEVPKNDIVFWAGSLVTEFDEKLWYTLVDRIMVYSKEDICFVFRDGAEIKI